MINPIQNSVAFKQKEERQDMSMFAVEDLVRQFEGEMPKERISQYLPKNEITPLTPAESILTDTLPFQSPNKTPVPSVKKVTLLQNRFVSLQKWQGEVIEVKGDTFWARLKDLTTKGVEEEAEFAIEEVSEEDKKLIKPGGVFYWNIGYQVSYQGQQTKVSIIRFRRLPAWKKEELDAAKNRAQKVQDNINWR